MKLTVTPLIEAIERYIAKEDNDLEEQLTAEGYAAVSEAIKTIGLIEEGVTDALNTHTDAFLQVLGDADSVGEFFAKTWAEFADADDLEKTLKQVFSKAFDDLMHECVFDYMLSQDAALAGVDKRITKPAEAFVNGWSGELSRLMKLNTNTQIEGILKRAVDKDQTIDEVEKAIADSGIRQCGYRSRRVAVTEVLRVESYSQLETMRQNPAVYKKIWRHTNVAAEPRQNHIDMDGQTVFKREPFTLIGRDGATYYPQCPRDTLLPAAESINCHCIMEEVKDELVLGMTDEERRALREAAMDAVDQEYEDSAQG